MELNMFDAMNQLNRNDLSTLYYTLCWYIGSENTRFDNDSIEELHTLRKKLDTIMEEIS